MPDYTAAEAKIINNAYNALYAWCEQYHGTTAYDLDRCVKQEIHDSRSPSLGQFSKAEARLYVLRQALRAIQNDNKPIAPSDLRIRTALAMAYIHVSACIAWDRQRHDRTNARAAMLALPLMAAEEVHRTALDRKINAIAPA